MKLRNLAMVLCASGTLAAVACSSSGDDSSASGGGGAGGKNTAGASGKGGASAGTAGKGGSAGLEETAGAGNEAGIIDTAGAAGMAGAAGEGPVSTAKDFTVTLENVAPVKAFTSSGVFNTPFATTAAPAATDVAGPATPGNSYKFTIDAGHKQKLFFATMLAATNDTFFAPDGGGIKLYLDDGTPVNGEVTSQIYLWDAGTELNEEPFVGPNVAGKQAAANTGPVDTNTKVRKVAPGAPASEGFAFSYPSVASLIKVSVKNVVGTTKFDVTIDDLAGAVLTTGDNVAHPVPLSPGVWVVSGAANALFTDQAPAPAFGLESLAEDGNPTALSTYAAANSGITYPASPGVWLVHKTGTKPLFTTGVVDYGKGLEAIAEDGNAAPLGANLASLDGYITGAVFNTPVAAVTPGPITPGAKYQFTFSADHGDSLSFASMLAATNDVFFAPSAAGIPLFDANGVALTGDISAQVSLWDAGTEANEEPGIGPNTVTNQLAPNTGAAGEGKVQLLSAVTSDTYAYPTAQSVLKVSIAAK